jgi:thiamine transport system ATP-binding protein
MLTVESVSVAFDGVRALDEVPLHVGTDETVAVLGPSGCGKTTLLRVIAGLQRSDGGRVLWDGADLAGVPPHERRFGLVFQEYALFPHRDVKGNVEFGLRMAGRNAADRAQRVAQVLDLVGLRELADRRVAGLSGGEQQRVALARAFAVSPRLLMLDEPLGALDRAWRARLLEEMRVLLDRERLPAIYVTHDQSEAFAIASRIVLMRAGRVVQDAAPAEIWRAPVDAAAAEFLGFGARVPGRSAQGRVETPWGSFPTTPVRRAARSTLCCAPTR